MPERWQIKRAKKRGSSSRARQAAFDMFAPQSPRYPDRLSLEEIVEASIYSPSLLPGFVLKNAVTGKRLPDIVPQIIEQDLPQPQQPIPAAGASARPEDSSDASQAQNPPAARGIPPTRKR